MNYQLYNVEEHEKEALAKLRISAMRESLEAIDRFDPARARGRFIDSFDKGSTRKIEIDGRLVGFYTLKDKADHLYLDHLYINPDYQGHGLGTSVMAFILSLAQRRKLPIRLGALRGSRSNRFYLSHGFVLTGESEWDIYYEYRNC